MMTQLSESIIEKIKDDNIRLVPKWHFLLKNYVFWSLFILSVLLGSFSFSVISHIINSGDFDLIDHLGGNIFSSGIMLLPLFWILSLIIFGVVSYINWKHTKRGYRIGRQWAFAGSFLLSMLFGSIFYLSGLGKIVDLIMVKSVPFYSQYKHRSRLELWEQPQNGLIIGRIIDLQDSNSFIMEDGKGNKWTISNSVQNKSKSELNQIIQKGSIVKILGVKDGEDCFTAKDIRSCKDCDGENDDYGGKDIDNDFDN